jgi:hypothetical protein
MVSSAAGHARGAPAHTPRVTGSQSLRASIAAARTALGDRRSIGRLRFGRILPARVRARSSQVGLVASATLTVAAAAVWVVSLPAIDSSRISDRGLIDAIPGSYLAAAMILAAGFILALNLPRLPRVLLAVDVILLAFMLHGVTSIVQEVPRFATTYVHAGFAEAIMRTGDLFVNRDARFSWPVFFILAAFLTSIAGFDNPLALAGWIPIISNLLYLIPLSLILRAFTVDRRLVWLGLWVFVLGNWVGQDYFSPQGFNILLYLTIIAILVTWFGTGAPAPFERIARVVRRVIRSPHVDGPGPEEAVPLPRSTRAMRTGLVLVMLVLMMVVVSSHQLTPFAMVAGTGILVLSRQTSLREAPILAGVLLGSWLSFMTLAYLAGHINALLSEALQAEAVASAAVGDRLRGNPGHIFIVRERIAFSAIFWGVAFLGGLRRLWNGHWDLSLALLAGYPFGFLALQSYGGEMLLRVYLFALPFMCFFVAGLFYPRLRSVSRLHPVLLLGLSCALVVGFFFARYGNDRADALTADELRAVDRADAYMPPGSVVVTSNHNTPLGYAGYDVFERLVGTGFVTFRIDRIVTFIETRAGDRRAFLFLSSGQREFFDLNGFPGEEWDALLQEIEANPRFRVVFRTERTVFFELVRAATGVAPGGGGVVP